MGCFFCFIRAKIDGFFKILPAYDSINQELLKSRTVYIKSPQVKVGEKKEKKKTLWDNLVFMFTPINYYYTKSNVVEDVFGK